MGKSTRETCAIVGCDRNVHGYGWCHRHYTRWREHGDPNWVAPTYTACRVDGCLSQPRSSRSDLCERHYYRIRRNGTVELTLPTWDLAVTERCEYCGQANDPDTAISRIYCSRRCATRARRCAPLLPPLCQVCAIRMPAGSRADRQWCDACWQDRRNADSRDRKHRRRIVVNGLDGEAYERIDDREIFERDGWRCGLCRKKVDRRLRSPHPMSASIDHVVPIAEGGRHVRANVQLAHRWCNGSKGSRGGGEQLALIG